MLKIGFLGAGRMAHAIAKGLIASGMTKGDLISASCAPQDVQCAEAFHELGAIAVYENEPVVKKSQVVFMAVKPFVAPTVLQEISPVFSKDHLLISVAMGVTLQQMEKALPSGSRVVRTMPNTPCLVGAGASVFTPGNHATTEDIRLTSQLLSAIGICEQIPEDLMDVVTAVSGSGPAYIFMVIEAMADGAVKMGMPRDLAYRLASQTVLGAGKMVVDTKSHPGQLKDNVMSPKGSTAAAVHYLEKMGLRAAVIGAIEEATNLCKKQSSP